MLTGKPYVTELRLTSDCYRHKDTLRRTQHQPLKKCTGHRLNNNVSSEDGRYIRRQTDTLILRTGLPYIYKASLETVFFVLPSVPGYSRTLYFPTPISDLRGQSFPGFRFSFWFGWSLYKSAKFHLHIRMYPVC
jgi:hypothetical protein